MFVHIEQHTLTVLGKAWEGKLVDYWTSFAADLDTQNSSIGYINLDTTGAILLQTKTSIAWRCQELKELNEDRLGDKSGGFCRKVCGRIILVVQRLADMQHYFRLPSR